MNPLGFTGGDIHLGLHCPELWVAQIHNIGSWRQFDVARCLSFLSERLFGCFRIDDGITPSPGSDIKLEPARFDLHGTYVHKNSGRDGNDWSCHGGSTSKW